MQYVETHIHRSIQVDPSHEIAEQSREESTQQALLCVMNLHRYWNPYTILIFAPGR